VTCEPRCGFHVIRRGPCEGLALGKKFVSSKRLSVSWQLGLISDEEYHAVSGTKGVAEVVEYVQARATEQDTVWSFADPLIDLNHLARRKPASRFWNPYYIFIAVAPFRLADRWQAEEADVLNNHLPKIIVMHLIDAEKNSTPTRPPGAPHPSGVSSRRRWQTTIDGRPRSTRLRSTSASNDPPGMVGARMRSILTGDASHFG